MSTKADLVLLNARVITVESDRPMISLVAIKGDAIVAVGDASDNLTFSDPGTRVIDCHGMTLIPGFHDSHCHPLALASSVINLDCRSQKGSSIDEIKELVKGDTHDKAPDSWVRGFGYDEALLLERRHPSRQDMDEAAPFHPVRLEHRSGHALVLNSQAMALLNITKETPDPVSGVIVRDEASREPTGLFIDMASHIEHLMKPFRRTEYLKKGVSLANELLLSKGITSIQDAGPENDIQRWMVFRRLKRDGALIPRVTMMVGYRHAAEFLDQGLYPGYGDDVLRIGGVKIMLTLTTGCLYPSLENLKQVALGLHSRGLQLVFHAVEREAIEAAALVIAEAQRVVSRGNARHRIEHCSEGWPEVVELIRSSGAMVVTQPSFIYHNGEKYISHVDQELQPHLYPLAALTDCGIIWAAGSDAPVTFPDPMTDIFSAVTRKTQAGQVLSVNNGVTVMDAMKAWTLSAAYSCFREDVLGTITAGKLADLVLLDKDPLTIPTEELKKVKVIMTILGGRVVWES